MSASEKLRAMAERQKELATARPDPGPDFGLNYLGPLANLSGDMARALPLIADVVEAAERVDRFRVQYEGAMITLGWTFGDVLAMTANHQALTALQAHLEGDEDDFLPIGHPTC